MYSASAKKGISKFQEICGRSSVIGSLIEGILHIENHYIRPLSIENMQKAFWSKMLYFLWNNLLYLEYLRNVLSFLKSLNKSFVYRMLWKSILSMYTSVYRRALQGFNLQETLRRYAVKLQKAVKEIMSIRDLGKVFCPKEVRFAFTREFE